MDKTSPVKVGHMGKSPVVTGDLDKNHAAVEVAAGVGAEYTKDSLIRVMLDVYRVDDGRWREYGEVQLRHV